MIGRTISHYKILEKLGEGGMGVVYKAQDTTLDRFVAIKFLPPHLSKDENATKRFIHEAKAASALDHANIGTIYEVEKTSDDRTFIVMAYYEGETLRERIDMGNISVEEALTITSQIASGLTRAHETEIVHRDIKPSNIIITKHGEAKVIDFGLAKLAGKTRLTKEGITLGTVAYMSPEQATGAEVDERSDIFSLGVVLYEMVTGEHPFKAEHEAALLYQIVHEEPEPLNRHNLNIPENLQEIIDKVLTKEVSKRYQSAKTFSADLARMGKRLSVTERESLEKRGGRRRLVPPIAIVAVLVAALACYGIYLQFFASSDEKSNLLARQGIFSILVAPYCGHTKPALEESLVMQRFLSRELNEIFKEEVNIAIAAADTSDRPCSHAEAKALGRRTGASMVLWGEVILLRGELEIQPYISIVSSLINPEKRSPEALQLKLTDQNQLKLRKAKAREVGSAALYAAARYYLDTNPKKALSIVQRLPDTDSKRFILQGDILYKLERPEEAIKSYTRASSLDQSDPIPIYRLGWIYQMMEKYDEAENEYKKVIELDINDPNSHARLAYFYSQFGKRDLTLVGLEKALALEPESAETLSLIGYVYNRFGLYKNAIDQYRKAVTLAPNDADIRCAIGAIYESIGDYEKAINEYNVAKDLAPLASWPHHAIGLSFHNRGLYNEAIEPLSQALELEPDNFSLYYTLGNTYAKLGNRSEAMKHFNKAVVYAEDGLGEAAYLFLGVNYRELGWYEEAVFEFQKAIESSTEGYYLEDFHYYLAYTYEEMGRYEDALNEYKEAVESGTDPDLGLNHSLQYFLSLCRFDRQEEAKIFISEYSKKYKDLKWRMSDFEEVIDFYTGEISEEEVLAAAEHGEDVRWYKCSVHYYIGMARLLNIETDSVSTSVDTVKAREHLGKCLELCDKEGSDEYYDRAIMEIKRLGNN